MGFAYAIMLTVPSGMREWRNRQTRTFEGRVFLRTGSSPVSRTRGISSAGRALHWQCRGQRFDPAMLHQ